LPLAPPPKAEKGLPPSRAQGALTHRGRLPPEPRRASPSRPAGGPLPCLELKNSGRLLPNPATKAQKPAVLTPTGRFCGPIWGAGPPSPPKTLLEASLGQVAPPAFRPRT